MLGGCRHRAQGAPAGCRSWGAALQGQDPSQRQLRLPDPSPAKASMSVGRQAGTSSLQKAGDVVAAAG